MVREQSEICKELALKHPDFLCMRCKEPAFAKCWTDAGANEVGLSGYCETCWTEIYGEDEAPVASNKLFQAWQKKIKKDG